MTQEKIIVGISGGVDSSVTALLLKQRGYDVHGVFMKNWEGDDHDDHCAAEADFNDAKQVCATLNIPLQGVNFADQYWDRVFQYFLQEYRLGRTPNPDVLCNREIKFHAFLDYALNLGTNTIATGHYARVRRQDGHYQLLRGLDNNKDQSYFLYMLNQHQLSHSCFPLGEIDKSEVRDIAKQHHLITHDKKDSTGICFIGERDFKAFLQQYLPAQSGAMCLPGGEVVGRHDGLMYYTRGQRQGLGLGGLAGYSGEPWYVADKDLANNRLIVVQGRDHSRLYSQWLDAQQIHWISGQTPTYPLHCTAKTRYRQEDAACVVTPGTDDLLHVEFDTAQWAVTPGQSVVFYQDEICLGGGIISNAEQIGKIMHG